MRRGQPEQEQHVTEAVIHRYGADPAQFGELSLPDGRPLGTVVVLHGGFWGARYDLSLGRPLAADLAARGYAAWNLEYRRSGNGGGWPATFEDVAAGIDLLATLPVDASRVAADRAQRGRAPRGVGGGASRAARRRAGRRPRVAVTGVDLAGRGARAGGLRARPAGRGRGDQADGRRTRRAAGTVPAGRPDDVAAVARQRRVPALPRRSAGAVLLQRALRRRRRWRRAAARAWWRRSATTSR